MPLTVGDAVLDVEIADTAEERSLGLMHRATLAADAGMLFVYPAPRPLSFWMKDTLVPLSIAFCDAEGHVLRVADMKPLDTSITTSGRPAMYAIEANAGWFRAHAVREGSVVHGLPPAALE